MVDCQCMKRQMMFLILGLGVLAVSSCSNEAMTNAAASAAGTAIRGGNSDQVTKSAVRSAIRTDLRNQD